MPFVVDFHIKFSVIIKIKISRQFCAVQTAIFGIPHLNDYTTNTVTITIDFTKILYVMRFRANKNADRKSVGTNDL